MNVGEFYKVSSLGPNKPENLLNSNKRKALHQEVDVEEVKEETIDDIVASAAEIEPLNSKNVRRLVVNLEKALDKNQKMRAKYVDEPRKFLDSELELHQEIRNLMQLAAFPEQYGILKDIVPALITLMTHENADIVLVTLEMLQELTDEEVIAEDFDPTNLLQFVDALCDNQILEILYNCLVQFDTNSGEDDERLKGIFAALSVIENISSLKPPTAEMLGSSTDILPWLLRKMSLNKGDQIDLTRQYSSEICAILLQSSEKNQKIALEAKAMDQILGSLALFRKRDPQGEEEAEFMENLFDILCALLDSPKGKVDFCESEGVELMCLMLKHKNLASIRALKALSHCLSTIYPLGASNVCVKLLDNSGLKYLLSTLQKKNVKRFKKDYSKAYSETDEEEYLMTIMVALFRFLVDQPPNFYLCRIIARLSEDDYENYKLILKMFIKYNDKFVQWLQKESEYAQELISILGEADTEEFQESMYLKRLENGLFTLQLISLVIINACAHEVKLIDMTRDELKGFESIKSILEEYVLNLGESIQDSGKSSRSEKLRVYKNLLVLIPDYNI